MTVIAARKYPDGVAFAADRQTTRGYNRVTSKEINLGKLVAANGLTIGGCGRKAHSQWLGLFARNHAPLEATESAVSEFMLEFWEWMRGKDSGFTSENQYLICFRGRLFQVDDHMSVFEVPEFSAVGSGQDFALAAMHLGNSPKEAAAVAAVLDIHCSGDIDEAWHPREAT